MKGIYLITNTETGIDKWDFLINMIWFGMLGILLGLAIRGTI